MEPMCKKIKIDSPPNNIVEEEQYDINMEPMCKKIKIDSPPNNIVY